MTLPPEKIGDKGQRFTVELKGYPKPGWQEVAFSDCKDSARRLGKSMMLAPSATAYRVVDRDETPKP